MCSEDTRFRSKIFLLDECLFQYRGLHFVVFVGKFDLRSACFDHGMLCVLCVQDIGQSGQTGVYVVCLQEQNRELEPV